MKRLFLCIILLFFTLNLTACRGLKPRTVERCFYYWKSSFSLTGGQLKTLHSLDISRMYVKFFDVIWEGEPIPDAAVRFQTRPPRFLDIVPTVFITNETLKNLPAGRVNYLAEKIYAKILRMAGNNLLNPILEVQVDCDWNGTTRDKYFRLLKEIRSRLKGKKIALSATIRLHQIKYRNQTGAPPVDRGMVMAYNIEPVQELQTKNSIFNPALIEDYTRNIDKYPLPLDVALPIFSWGVIFQDDRFIGLVNNLNREDLCRKTIFHVRGNSWYDVVKDTVVRGIRLYRGDSVRLETSDPREVLTVAEFLRKKIPGNLIHIAAYHFDDLSLRRTGHAEIQKFFTAFIY